MKKTSWLKWICCLSMVSQVAVAESEVTVYGSLGYRHSKETVEVFGRGVDFSRAAVNPTISADLSEKEVFKRKQLLFKAGTEACFDNICLTGEVFMGMPIGKGSYSVQTKGDISAITTNAVKLRDSSTKMKGKQDYGVRGSLGYKFFPTDSWVVTPNLGLRFEHKSKKIKIKKDNDEWSDNTQASYLSKAGSWGPSLGVKNKWQVSDDICINFGVAYALNYKKGPDVWAFGQNVNNTVTGTMVNGRKKVREKGWQICGSVGYKMDETMSLSLDASYEAMKGSKRNLPATMKYSAQAANKQDWNLENKLKDQTTEVALSVHYLF